MNRYNDLVNLGKASVWVDDNLINSTNLIDFILNRVLPYFVLGWLVERQIKDNIKNKRTF